MNQKNNKTRKLFFYCVDKYSLVVLLVLTTSNAMAANKGNISAAVNTFIIGAIVAVLISLVFALQRNQNGQLAGLKTGKFFLLLSILILIVFVTATAAFFIFM